MMSFTTPPQAAAACSFSHPKQRKIHTALILSLVLCLTASTSAWARPSKHPTPVGFEKYLVYMADGLYDPTTPHPDGIPGCNLGICDGDYFQEVIMGRTAAQIALEEAAAVVFFQDRFGLDVDDPANAGRLFFQKFMVDPRTNYRARSISRERVSQRGWLVQDGGWMVVVIDPNGFDLGGEFAGVHVPANATFVFGDYKIEARSRLRRPIVIHYQSGKPIVANADGSLMFQCQLISDTFGEGLAQGIADQVAFENGQVKMNIRNVLTFSGLGEPLP